MARLLSRWGRFGSFLRAVAVAVAVLVVMPYVIAPFYRFVDPISTLMLWRWITGARVEHQWTPIKEISPALPLAVIVAEDGQFCTHHGIDFGELRQAFQEVDDLSDARGGSTLTQQVAKNLFLWQSRSYVRKVLEFPLAMWVDLVLPKRRILEIYLNIAEWGPNGEFGAQAAAQRDFGLPAAQLRPPEAALMAATLPNPFAPRCPKTGSGPAPYRRHPSAPDGVHGKSGKLRKNTLGRWTLGEVETEGPILSEEVQPLKRLARKP